MSKTVSFSYFGTKLIIVSAALGAIFVMIIATVFGINPNKSSAGPLGSVIYPTSLTSLASGCGDFNVWNNLKAGDQYAVIPASVTKASLSIPKHQMIVPVYGYMNQDALTSDQIRFYGKGELKTPFSEDKILATMYRDNTSVIWYSPRIAASDYSDLKNYVAGHKNVLAVEWVYGSGQLPLDRKVAFSSWGISQSCEFWTDSTFKSFQDFKLDNKISRVANAPEAKLTSNGMLPQLVPVVNK